MKVMLGEETRQNKQMEKDQLSKNRARCMQEGKHKGEARDT